MRHHLVAIVVLMLLLCVASAATASIAGAVSFMVSMDTKFEAPAGEITIWFTNQAGEVTYYFTGSELGGYVLLPGNDPEVAMCHVWVKLTGRLSKQVVESTWKPEGGNVFCCPVSPGMQEASFWFHGRETNHLKILFVSIGVGSKSVKIEESFRMLVQSPKGRTDYCGQLALAQRRWPALAPADHELWARTWVNERWYLKGGLVPVGTEARPVVSTETMGPENDMLQSDADKAKREAEARARAEAEAKAQEETRRREAEARAERERLEAERRANEVVSWSIYVGESESGWAVWTSGSDKPLRVKDTVIRMNSRRGTYWIEVVPWGASFQRWHCCTVTDANQQINFQEVK